MCTMCTPLPMGLSLPSHETDIPSNSLDRGEGKFTGRSRNFGKGKRGEGGGGGVGGRLEQANLEKVARRMHLCSKRHFFQCSSHRMFPNKGWGGDPWVTPLISPPPPNLFSDMDSPYSTSGSINQFVSSNWRVWIIFE